MGLRKNIRKAFQIFESVPSEGLGFSFDRFGWLLSRDPSGIPELALSGKVTVDDLQLVRRVMAAYSTASGNFVPTEGFWDKSIRTMNSDIHSALTGTDKKLATEKLRNPASNSHFWGFDAVTMAPDGSREPHAATLRRLNKSVDWQQLYAIWLLDTLTSLADAVGARRLSNPESPRVQSYLSPDELLDNIERTIGNPVHFPNPYPDELGLKTKRGIAGFRSLQSIYQGWRIAQLSRGKESFSVLEIGAGLGRTAYYATQFGIEDYSIIDIPLTGAAQSYFLGRVLGEENVRLFGEKKEGLVEIIPASELENMTKTYDLIVNVDSLTELPKEVMNAYWEFSKKSTKTFLSINHELNESIMSDLYSENTLKSVTRYPYWLRRGYTEEVITF